MYKIYPKTIFTGQIVHYLPSCQSTNDEAAGLIAHSDPAEGTLVITDQQTAGRGQRGNQWEAQTGQNLTCSLILHPTFLRATEQFWLNMAVSLGIYDTLHPLLGERASELRIKWPNDIYVGTRKMGGILIENGVQGYQLATSIIGMGLNINQTQFGYSTATSLQQEAALPDGYDLPGLLGQLCEKLEARYLQLRTGQRDAIRAAYLQTLYRYQQEAPYEANEERFSGTITGVDEAGRLIINEYGRERVFGFKEVIFL
ncbi:biotin--[acetyl-CoA-carboxylase] ligase [Spirosoma rhododendri]|uniref:Biotin--[acetyl-CoA-carboxylase] ligase n=1 Tax=Spirosoma rhododendri TaxID=2728024 RepID=A0A7L5DUC9_9BACT|nr:biotin--[acetyl-CoA-carboxylase] ligase [Spirosoma rhododendri]QJD80933.1 biotin--[acetyl-CoA-carboxylase] ligase [Spirosoma rhododendri]